MREGEGYTGWMGDLGKSLEKPVDASSPVCGAADGQLLLRLCAASTVLHLHVEAIRDEQLGLGERTVESTKQHSLNSMAPQPVLVHLDVFTCSVLQCTPAAECVFCWGKKLFLIFTPAPPRMHPRVTTDPVIPESLSSFL